jgi:hypothetical protein
MDNRLRLEPYQYNKIKKLICRILIIKHIKTNIVIINEWSMDKHIKLIIIDE